MAKSAHILITVIALFTISAMSYASSYTCDASLSNIPSVIWSGSYRITVRPTFGSDAAAQVRLNRYYPGGNLPRGEFIDMRCVAGSNNAEYDCVETAGYNGKQEILAAQFYVNGWARLYASPRREWNPYPLSDIQCLRQ